MLVATAVPAVVQPIDTLDSAFVVEVPSEDSIGAGFVVEGDLVVTAAHVVGDAGQVLLRSAAPRDITVPGRVIYRDPVDDIAVIAPLRSTGAPVLELTTQAPAVDDVVFAVGSPIGDLVLSRGAVLDVQPTLIETSTPVDPGSSGGPLVAGDGRVLGVVVAMDRLNGNAFAVPSTQLEAALDIARSSPAADGDAAVPVQPSEPSVAEVDDSIPPIVWFGVLIAFGAFVLAGAALAVVIISYRQSHPKKLVITMEDTHA